MHFNEYPQTHVFYDLVISQCTSQKLCAMREHVYKKVTRLKPKLDTEYAYDGALLNL